MSNISFGDIYLNDSLTNDTVRPRFPIHLKDVVNSSFSRDIFANLPPKRNDDVDCPLLKTQDSLSSLIPGWEGIPTNFVLNIILTLVCLQTMGNK